MAPLEPPASPDAARKSWGEALLAFRHPRVVAMFFFGFSAGLPLVLIFSTLSVWLREAGIERSTVTFFSWAALGYSFKYVWAPLVDRLPLPFLTARLGRRRSWLLFFQLAIVGAILWMAASDPQANLTTFALASVVLGFSSASQDIVIDAYRIEAAPKDLQAMMSSSYIAGYRVGMLAAGAGALKLASLFGDAQGYVYAGWAKAYLTMAFLMTIGVATTLTVREPEATPRTGETAFRKTSDYLRFFFLFAAAGGVFALGFFFSREAASEWKKVLVEDAQVVKEVAGFLVESSRLGVSLALAAVVGGLLVLSRAVPARMVRETYVEPCADFIRRYGKVGFLVLLLIATYRVSDIVLGAIANVFYIDVGFTKDQIAAISKTFGLFMTILGGFLGGVLSVRYGMFRTLFLGAFLSAVTNVLFAVLASHGSDPWMLVAVITADNLSGGLATAAFIAYLSSLTSVSFTATQYALFSSIMTLFPKVLAGYSGMMSEGLGYPWFFVGTAIMGVPVLFLVLLAARIEARAAARRESEPT